MDPVLVLLHGFTQTGRSWVDVRRRLATRYRSVAPDLRGHGAARDVRPVDAAGLVDDLDALVLVPVAVCQLARGADQASDAVPGIDQPRHQARADVPRCAGHRDQRRPTGALGARIVRHGWIDTIICVGRGPAGVGVSEA